ncbi:Cullin-domain-containing protein [Neoconidiobolus thromboides FSU 785]|nr:Cullin-domain-containing protein [Neoconidiobolus thromboides FSU 785]
MKQSFMEHFKSCIEGQDGNSTLQDLSSTHNYKPKRLMIKNFKELPSLPADFKETNWKKLETSIIDAFDNSEHKLRAQELYKCCEVLCRQGHASYIHKNLKSLLEQRVDSKFEFLKSQNNDKLGHVVLAQTIWEDYINKMQEIRSIFIFLDQYYALPTPGVPSVWDMGLNIFKDRIATQEDIAKNTIFIILDLLQKERQGEEVDGALIKNLVKMLHDIGKYDQKFEQMVVNQAEEYYKALSENEIKPLNLENNLNLVERKLRRETERARNYLSKNSLNPVLNVIHKYMIVDSTKKYLDEDFSRALLDGNHPVLAMLFRVFKEANVLDQLNKAFFEVVLEVGTKTISNPEKDKEMIEDILQYREKMVVIVNQDFQNPIEFHRSLVRAFEDFMATRGSAPAKLLAKALDSVLKSGNLKLTDEQVDQKLDKLFSLFKFIQGKDIFEAFYKQSLAKRLLLNRSASYDTERFMITKLKGEIGSEYTEKLDGMFKDIEVSDDMTKLYKEKYPDLPYEFDISINVLTQANWPTYSPSPAKLPPKMEAALQHFTTYYNEQHSVRRLFWQHSLSKAVLVGNFIKGRKELTVSLFQALVLLLFNQKHSKGFTMKEIREMTEIENDQLKLILASLSSNRIQLLFKSPDRHVFSDRDVYTFNEDFESPAQRIKVNALQLKDTVRGDNRIQDMVIHNRQFLIDAIIVRLMKSKKKMMHVDLMSETLKGLQFPVEPAMIRLRIENLIERDFLERDPDAMDILIYLA